MIMTHLLFFLYYGSRYSGATYYMKNMSPEEFLFGFFAPMVVFALIVGILYLQRYEISLTKIHRYLISLSPSQLEVLGSFKYYNVYPNSEKIRFQKRVRNFLVNKRFMACDMEKVSEEMKVLIAAACVHLTFGHRPFYLSHFKRVYVYPNYHTDVKPSNKKNRWSFHGRSS